jgi:hypothetical protein
MKNIVSIFIAAVMLVSFSAFADDTAAIQFSSFDFNAPKAKAVNGVRFPAIYGKQGGNIQGVDVQLLALSEMESLKGVSIPVWLLGGNKITGDMTGVSLGLLSWHEGNDVGANLSMINFTNNVKGLNLGMFNVSTGTTSVDISATNVSETALVQVGLVNVTGEIKGVQIGVLNCARNGFLRCFPFVLWGK